MRPKRQTFKDRLAYWQPRLGLGDWLVKASFGAVEGGCAECDAQPEYRIVTVRFDPRQIRPQDVDAVVVHELLHALVWPLAHVGESLAAGDAAKEEWVRTEEESLVTALERLVLRLDASTPTPAPAPTQ